MVQETRLKINVGGESMKILLIEDDEILSDTIKEALLRERYEVDQAFDGQTGSEMAVEKYDLILLDVMLPYKDGFSVLKEVRNLGIETPIIMLTARAELDDKLNGLDNGADDYITKPFALKELIARIRSNTRRNAPSNTYGDIMIKSESMINMKTKETVNLGAKELALLQYLIVNKDQIISKEQIAIKIWGYNDESEYNNVEVYISFLRKKLNFIHSSISIKTIRNMGYKLI